MHKKNFFLELFAICLMITISYKGTSQKLVYEKKIQLKSGMKVTSEAMPIVIDEKKMALVLLDKKNITTLEINEHFKETAEYTTLRPPMTYTNLLGHSRSSHTYYLFFSNSKKDQFFVKTIDVQERSSSGKVIPIELEKERFLEVIHDQNKFYLFTVVKKSSVIKLYVFEGSELVDEQKFDLSQYRFPSANNFSLYSSLGVNKGSFQPKLKISKVDSNSPVPLAIASQPSKIYHLNNTVYITLDDDLNQTQIISIDLNSYEYKVDIVLKELLDCGADVNIVSNSFLTNDVIYMVNACPSNLVIQARSLETKDVLSEYRVTKDEEISFKNGQIRQRGGTSDFSQNKNKELVNTKQVLRKISNSQAGISARTWHDKIELTTGGYIQVQQGGGGGFSYNHGSSFSTPGGTVTIPGNYSYNPTMYGYSKYKNTRSVRFKTLLSADSFKHIEGEVGQNSFDKIKTFEDRWSVELSAKTIFRAGDFYIFGYYSGSQKSYIMHQFFDD